jgi:hypothetical protein
MPISTRRRVSETRRSVRDAGHKKSRPLFFAKMPISTKRRASVIRLSLYGHPQLHVAVLNSHDLASSCLGSQKIIYHPLSGYVIDDNFFGVWPGVHRGVKYRDITSGIRVPTQVLRHLLLAVARPRREQHDPAATSGFRCPLLRPIA